MNTCQAVDCSKTFKKKPLAPHQKYCSRKCRISEKDRRHRQAKKGRERMLERPICAS